MTCYGLSRSLNAKNISCSIVVTQPLPEVTSRSRDVNKHGDGVNEFTPLLKCKLGLMDKYIFLFDLNDIKIILIDLIIMQITFIDM